MEKEDNELLLKDLCARLPYGVKAWYKYKTWNFEKFATSIRLADEKIALSSKFNKEGDWFSIEEAEEILIKPYLRTMSSMTEEEKVEYCNLQDKFLLSSQCPVTDGYALFDWLDKNMFDYRGLIEKGLAIEVTKENNPYKD